MIVFITNDQKNNYFSASLTTEADTLDMAYMDAYSEPRIDTAGVIPYTNSLSVVSSFTIAGGPAYSYIRSGMPISFGVQLSMDPEAKGKAAGWGVEMKARIAAAMIALRTNATPNVPNTSRFSV
jgi:hypothetical protein